MSSELNKDDLRRSLQEALDEREQNNPKQQSSNQRVQRFKESFDVRYEALFAFTIGFHLLDGFIFKFHVNQESFVARLVAYLILGIFTVLLIRSDGGRVKIFEPPLVAAIPAIVVPVLVGGVDWLNIGNQTIIDGIAFFLIAVPVYLFYLVYILHLQYAPSVERNANILEKVIRAIFSPVRWAHYYFILLTVFSLSVLLFIGAGTLNDEMGSFSTGGIDTAAGFNFGSELFSATIGRASESFRSIWIFGQTTIEQTANRTFGWQYHGTVERNTRDQGLFLTPLTTRRSFPDTSDLIYTVTVRAESFEESIDADIACSLHDRTNRTNIIEGAVDNTPITLGRSGIDTFSCIFDESLLQPGEYTINITAEFGFETWSSTIYSFVLNDVYEELVRGETDPNQFFNIERYPSLIYTGGPVRLLMANSRADRDRPSMPMVISAERDNNIPIATKIENDNPRDGKILEIDSIEFRIPSQLELASCDGGIPETRLDDRFEGRTSEDVYSSHAFTSIPRASITDDEFSVACALVLPQSQVNNFISSRGDRSFTVNSVANYRYQLEQMRLIEIQGETQI